MLQPNKQTQIQLLSERIQLLSQRNSTPKHLVPHPSLRKKGHCLKGSRCDFSHQFDPQQASKSYQPYNAQPLFKDKMPSYLPPVMNLPTFPVLYELSNSIYPPINWSLPIQQNSTSSNELSCFEPSTTDGNLYKTPPILRYEDQRKEVLYGKEPVGSLLLNNHTERHPRQVREETLIGNRRFYSNLINIPLLAPSTTYSTTNTDTVKSSH